MAKIRFIKLKELQKIFDKAKVKIKKCSDNKEEIIQQMKKEMHVIQSMPKIEDEGLYSYSSEYGSEDEDEPEILGLTKAQISHFPKFKFNN